MKGIAGVATSAALLVFLACGGSGDDTQQQAPPSAATAAPAQADTASPPPPVAARPAPVAAMPQADEPWSPADTGTVDPGMSREQVIAVWGVPVAESVTGTRGYLYFRNGCEVSCGTFDVVLLENGQVVDAIVRGRGHTYSGTSSSPPGRLAAPNLPPVPGSETAG